MLILLPADPDPLHGPPTTLRANSHRIRSCSNVAATFSDDDEAVWDLSNLLIGGQPVERSTVVAWLNGIYSTISGSCFEEQQELPTRTACGLHKLLAFADAVDTEPGIVQALMSHLDDLVIRASMGQQQVQLCTDGRSYFFDGMQLSCSPPGMQYQVGMPAPSSQEQRQLSTDVAQQLEALLYYAHSMQLRQLVQKLHAFISSNASNTAGTALLHGVLGVVFSDRVVTAALGPVAAAAGSSPADTRRAWISSVLTQPCGVAPGMLSPQQLLGPLKLPSKLQGPLQFQAELMQDCWGSSRGERVSVTLDLFYSSSISIGSLRMPVQLLVGPVVSNGAACSKICCSRLDTTCTACGGPTAEAAAAAAAAADGR
jgi:hypothetical protein